ncbi:MAG: hypothetical protein E7331_12505 [Clostridiales bacterium]|nr:hypothetical protein [Clostridiales bacterium]
MDKNQQTTDSFGVGFGEPSQWHDLKSLGDLIAQGIRTKCYVTNRYKRPWKGIPIEIVRYRDIAKEEMYLIGEHGDFNPLALYNGNLYKVRKPLNSKEQDIYMLGNQFVHKNAIEAIYAACFVVCYKHVWYRCIMIGGKDIDHVSVVVDDPHGYTGLGSAHNRYMWGDGVELEHDQIEAVRLCISDPITTEFFE